MRHDDRRQKLIANLIAGMNRPEAARAAGYSDSFSRVNVYELVNRPDFQDELALARAAEQTSPGASKAHSPSGATHTPQGMDSLQDGLTADLPLKQQLFRDLYLGEARGNGTLAAKLAGYSGDYNTLAVMAHNLLKIPKIQESIQKVRDKSLMDAEEVLCRLSKHGRASIADVLDKDGMFNLETAKERGAEDLVRKVKIRRRTEHGRDGTVTEVVDHELELHNSQTALELMGRHHKLFTDRVETETKLSPEDIPRIAQELYAIFHEARQRKLAAEAAKAAEAERQSERTTHNLLTP